MRRHSNKFTAILGGYCYTSQARATNEDSMRSVIMYITKEKRSIIRQFKSGKICCNEDIGEVKEMGIEQICIAPGGVSARRRR